MSADLYFKEATEPTNIIWENRYFTPKDRLKRSMHAFLLIGLLVLISFLIISVCKTVALSISNMYDASNCDTLTKAYGSNDTMMSYAFDEYTNSTKDDYSLSGVL